MLMSRGSLMTFSVIAVVSAASHYLQRKLSLDPLLTVRVVEFCAGIALMRLVVDSGRRHFTVNCLGLIACLAFIFLEGGRDL